MIGEPPRPVVRKRIVPKYKGMVKAAEAEALFYRTQAECAARKFRRERLYWAAAVVGAGLVGAWL